MTTTTTTMSWIRLDGAAGYDVALSLSTGLDGALYLAGSTQSNPSSQIQQGGIDAFISNYNPDGSSTWTQLLSSGTTSAIESRSLTTGLDGAVYLAGYTYSNLDGQANQGGRDAFVIRYNIDGSKAWTNLLGEAGNDEAKSLTTGLDGAIYVAGYTFSNLDGQTNHGNGDAFITRYDANGTKAWTQSLGGLLEDCGCALTTGLDGAVYLAGFTHNDLDGQPAQGQADAFITRFNADGSKAWTQLLGGTGDDGTTQLTTGLDGAIYMTGYTQNDLDGETNHGGYDAFITRYNTDGSKAWTRLLGGTGDDVAKGLTTGLDGTIYVTGYTQNDLDGQTNHGDYDVFVTSYNADGTKAWTQLLGGAGSDFGNSLTTGLDGSIYVSGNTENNLEGQTNHGSFDAFVLKIGGAVVADVNHAPIGEVSISGTAVQHETLTASNTLTDIDGLDTISYQWQADGQDIAGATAPTLTLNQAQVGKTISVVASYTDAGGTLETVASAATEVVANVNDAPTGLTLAGNATQGQTLTPANTFADADGLGTISYQWQADGSDLSGANSQGLTLRQEHVGKVITLVASYTDGFGAQETAISAPSAVVANANDAPIGEVSLSGTPQQYETLTASNSLTDIDGLGSISYQWLANGSKISGATGESLTLSQAQVGKTISVVASYTDAGGTLETVSSAATEAVANANDAPIGSVSISGTPQQYETLRASNSLTDIDGLGAISYQWQANGQDISGATSASLTLSQEQVGNQISVVASYTDAYGAQEIFSSDWLKVANVNDAVSGIVSISGTAVQHETLTASNTLTDIDGLDTISYQWQADGQDIAGATAPTLTLNQAQVGKTISVVASYTDAGGTLETVASAATEVVANVNDAPTGLTLAGNATQGQTLTPANTFADADGLGTISYQWQADGSDLSGANSQGLTLRQEHVGKVITLVASYTDGFGAQETAISAPSAVVANANDAPIGEVSLSGTPQQYETLTASNSLTDIDGLGSISYQWLANGSKISGATGESLTLSQAQVGRVIRVVASYTDGFGVQESVSSSASARVANVNDALSGSISISGLAQQYQTLTANSTLADIDGLGALRYQWQADGIDINGATGSRLTLGQAQVGKAISVVTSYVDAWGTFETFTSAETATVINVNDSPFGAVKISGTAKFGKTLVASNTLGDIDGLGAMSYQWQHNDIDIAGATASSLTLGEDQLGKAITVIASYTDGYGATEAVTSNTLYAVNYNTSADENTKAVTTLEVTDPLLSATPKFKLSGLDASLFKISNTGVLTFIKAKDLEQPVDSNHDDIYRVSVTMTNAKTGYKVVKNLTVGVEFTPIVGTDSADTLKGTNGFDTLDGLGGDDKLIGGTGLDTFLITSGHDEVLDFNSLSLGSTGNEILQVSRGAIADVMLKSAWKATSDSYNEGVANLTTTSKDVDLSAINHGQGWKVTNKGTGASLTGSQFNDVLTGGNCNDVLTGGAGNDLLIGGKGADLLTGGTGADIFRLSGFTKVDHITDFLSGTDRIELDHLLYKALGTGQLAANQFVQGTTATNTTQRIVYDLTSGNLWYDADGSGSKAAVLVGVLDNHVQLLRTDLYLV